MASKKKSNKQPKDIKEKHQVQTSKAKMIPGVVVPGQAKGKGQRAGQPWKNSKVEVVIEGLSGIATTPDTKGGSKPAFKKAKGENAMQKEVEEQLDRLAKGGHFHGRAKRLKKEGDKRKLGELLGAMREAHEKLKHDLISMKAAHETMGKELESWTGVLEE